MKYKHLKIAFNKPVEFPAVLGRSILYPTQLVCSTINSCNEVKYLKTDPFKYAVHINGPIDDHGNTFGCFCRYHVRKGVGVFIGHYGFKINSVNIRNTPAGDIRFVQGEVRYRIDDDFIDSYLRKIKKLFYKYNLQICNVSPSTMMFRFTKNSYDMMKRFYLNNERGINYHDPLGIESEYERLKIIEIFLKHSYGII